MRKLLIAALLLFPSAAFAGHEVTTEINLKDGCSLEKYMAITKDFNEWGKTVGYTAEVVMPIKMGKITSMLWRGTSADAATFAKAWEAWREALADPDSTPSGLLARFDECEENFGRRGDVE